MSTLVVITHDSGNWPQFGCSTTSAALVSSYPYLSAGTTLFRVFLLSLLLGIAVTVAAAWFYPVPVAPRVQSESIALNNGGREESFYILLPSDRIGSPQATAVAAFPERGFARDGEGRIVAELYKVRNSGGTVIGLASRVSGAIPITDERARENADWMLMLPGRGALMMSTEARSADMDDRYERDTMGLNPARAGRILKGTEKFTGLTGFFVEELQVDSVDEFGQVSGTLTLVTRIRGVSSD